MTSLPERTRPSQRPSALRTKVLQLPSALRVGGPRCCAASRTYVLDEETHGIGSLYCATWGFNPDEKRGITFWSEPSKRREGVTILLNPYSTIQEIRNAMVGGGMDIALDGGDWQDTHRGFHNAEFLRAKRLV